MDDVILTFETVREQAIYETYSKAVEAYKTTLSNEDLTSPEMVTELATKKAAVVAAYPAFIKVLKFKVGDSFYKGIIFLNKFLVCDGLSTNGLKDISTQLTAYTSAASVADGKVSHDALVVYLDDAAFFVQEFGREGGFVVTEFTDSANDDRDRVGQITDAEEINDGSSSILTAPEETITHMPSA